MCVLMHVLVGINVSVIMCILVWIHVHVCVAPPIVVGAWPMAGCYGGFLSIIIIPQLHHSCASKVPKRAVQTQ